MKIEVKTLSNENSGSVDVPEAIFGLAPRKDILERVVTWQLAKRRSGNHAVKSRSQVSGTNKKPYRQKGTGNARQGSLRTVQFRTGGVVHGPVVRDHGFSLPKKVRKLGLRTALSVKLKEGKLIVLKTDGDTPHKTKDISAKLNALAPSVLIVGNEELASYKKPLANLPEMDILPVVGLNVYDVLKHDLLAISQSSLDALQERLS